MRYAGRSNATRRAEAQNRAERYSARVAVVEVPPGPPVLQTLVAEIRELGDS
jgi:hypothetical protein